MRNVRWQIESLVPAYFPRNEAPRSSLLRRSSHFGYEGRKLRGMRRRRIISVEYAPKTNTSEQDLFVNSPVPRGSQEVIYGYHSHDDAQWNVSFPFQNP
jgi:hypothetical protein